MRVAHICGAFSPLSETFIYDQITELEAQGEECHVMTLRRENEASRPFPRIHTLTCPWSLRRMRDRLLVSLGGLNRERYMWPYLRPQLEDELRKIRPDIIHAHFGPMGMCAAPIARALQVPLVVSFYGFDATVLPRDGAWRMLLHEIFAHADAIIVLSKIMKRQLEQLGSVPERTHIVHLGKRLHEFPFSSWNGRSIRHWISVGRLTEKKGHLDCIQAFQSVATIDPKSTLTIIGEGETRNAIEALISQLGLKDRVRLIGALSNQATRDRMRSSDAFILCSRTALNGDSEGTPTVLLEAQALGLPCVTTNHSGIPEIIPPESKWLLAPEGDINGIANRMLDLTRLNPAEIARLTFAGRKLIEEHFNISFEVDKIRSLYTKIKRTNNTFLIKN